ENGGERDGEDFLAKLVGGVEHPAAPIFLAGGHDIGAHDAMGVFAGLDQIVDGDAAPGGELVFFVGAVEKDAGHVLHPWHDESSSGTEIAAQPSIKVSGRFRGTLRI